MISITLLLVLVALVFVLLNAAGKLQAWPSILVLILIELLRLTPVR